MSSRDAQFYKFKYNVVHIQKGKAKHSELEITKKYLDCSNLPLRLPLDRIISFRLNHSTMKKHSDRVIVFHAADFEIVAESQEQRNAILKSFLSHLGPNQKMKRDLEKSLKVEISTKFVVNDDLKESQGKPTKNYNSTSILREHTWFQLTISSCQ